MVRKKYSTIFLITLITGFLIFVPRSFAAFNLTAIPTEGSFDIRFGKVMPTDFKQSREIILQIVSDIGKQYVVSQQVIQPLTSSTGDQLPGGQFRMYPLINSNLKGTLLFQEELPIDPGSKILYNSNVAGESDSFKLIYTITPEIGQMPGSYFGKIVYVLMPVNSLESQVNVTVNIYVELSAGSAPIIDVKTKSGTNLIALTSKIVSDAAVEFPKVFFKINGPVGASYRIYQQIPEGQVVGSKGSNLDLAQVLFTIGEGRGGTIGRNGTLDVAGEKYLLYTSNSSGSGDEFSVTYVPGEKFKYQKADFYKSKINYLIEVDGVANIATGIFQALNLECDVVPLFELIVRSGKEKGLVLEFGKVKEGNVSKTEVDVEVESNMGQAYQVIQKFAGPLASEKGDKISDQDFRLQVSDITSQEEPKQYIKELQPVSAGGDMVLFTSGSGGMGSSFKVRYELVVKGDSRGGDYASNVGYSLSLI